MRLATTLLSLALAGCVSRDPLAEALARRDLDAVRRAIRDAYPDVPTISTADLAAALAGDRPPLIVDARSAEEFEVSHLPGAARVTGADVPRDRPIIVYCSVGVRSSKFARRLIGGGGGGGPDVRQLDGSIFLWAVEGRPMVDSSGRATRVVHPYDRRWGELLPAEIRAIRADQPGG